MFRICRASSSTQTTTRHVGRGMRLVHPRRAQTTTAVPDERTALIDEEKFRKPLRQQGRPQKASASARPVSAQLSIHLARYERTRVDQSPTVATYVALLKEVLAYIERYKDVSEQKPSDRTPSLGMEMALSLVRSASHARLDIGSEGHEVLYQIAQHHPEILPPLLITASELGTFPPSLIVTLLKLAGPSESLSQSLFVLCELLKRGHPIPPNVLRDTIEICCTWANPRLALEIAAIGNTSSAHAVQIDQAMRGEILVCCAENDHVEGVETAWEHAVNSGSFAPDEGTITRVLDVAARHGRTALAYKALQSLSTLGVASQNPHILSLMESHVNSGEMIDAIKTLSMLPSDPSVDTIAPLILRLNTAELIDKVFFALEDAHKNGEKIAVLSLNALIIAAVRAKDMHRARAIQSAMSDMGCEPTIETFNGLLLGCVEGGHTSLGETIMKDITRAGLSPTATTFNEIISLSLVPDEYEDSFVYLEQMKAQGLKPSKEIYQRILDKCRNAGDGRWRYVLEEMQEMGYKPT